MLTREPRRSPWALQAGPGEMSKSAKRTADLVPENYVENIKFDGVSWFITVNHHYPYEHCHFDPFFTVESIILPMTVALSRVYSA